MAEFINTIDVLGDDAVIDSIIDRTITEFKDDKLIVAGHYAFNRCTGLKTVDLPNLTSIGMYAFQGCTSLVEVDFPNVVYGGSGEGLNKGAFSDCTALKSVRFEAINRLTSQHTNQFSNCLSLIDVFLPNLTNTSPNMFSNCVSLEKISLPSITGLSNNTFSRCSSLKAVILPNETLATNGGSNVFLNCYHLLGNVHATYNPEGLKDGYIYVPRALVDSYKTATNWSTYADQFRALEDYTVDGTTTGELDESKI